MGPLDTTIEEVTRDNPVHAHCLIQSFKGKPFFLNMCNCYKLQLHHMNVMAFQITDNSTFYLRSLRASNNETSQLRIIDYLWAEPGNSPHKGP